MRSERTPHARRYWAALIFVLLGTMAGVLHNRTTEKGRPDPVSVVVRGVVAPPANALARTSHWFSDQTGWLFRGRALATENNRLKLRAAQLEAENAKLKDADIKYAQMRSDLGYVQKLTPRPIAADVSAIRPDPKFDTMLLLRGSLDGIHPRSVVVTPAGLVGRVTEVTPNTASVLLLTDQNSGAGALVQRASSRAKGIIKGDNSTFLSLIELASDANIKKDDVIVTSGMGGVFPPGLVIGTVMDVMYDAGNLNKRARIRPAVDFNRLEQVYILP